MTDIAVTEKPFSERFRASVEAHLRRPLAHRLGVMVRAGLITEGEREALLKQAAQGRAGRAKARKR